jgi:hypothetical protein
MSTKPLLNYTNLCLWTGLEEMEDGGFRMKTQEFVADDVPAASTQPPTPEQQPGQRPANQAAAGEPVHSLDLGAAEGKGAGGLPLEMNAVHHVTMRDVQRKMPIGDGAFGEVCRATIPIFGEVAVKWLKVRPVLAHSHVVPVGWERGGLI